MSTTTKMKQVAQMQPVHTNAHKVYC